MTTIKDKVLASKGELTTLDTKGLFEWAETQGMGNRSAFSRFKKALLEIGINYEQMREAAQAQKAEAVQQALTHEITLYSDAKAQKGRFAITDEEGSPIWFGKFFDNDPYYNGEQSSAEMAAAQKAVWLAAKAKELTGIENILLNLKVDAKWLTWANSIDERGGNARALALSAKHRGVALNVIYIPGKENPADEYTTFSGYQKWQEYEDITDLITPISTTKGSLHEKDEAAAVGNHIDDVDDDEGDIEPPELITFDIDNETFMKLSKIYPGRKSTPENPTVRMGEATEQALKEPSISEETVNKFPLNNPAKTPGAYIQIEQLTIIDELATKHRLDRETALAAIIMEFAK